MDSSRSTLLHLEDVPERSASLPRHQPPQQDEGFQPAGALSAVASFHDENENVKPGRTLRWSLPAGSNNTKNPVTSPPSQPKLRHRFSQHGSKSPQQAVSAFDALPSFPTIHASGGFVPEAYDRQELIALARTLHIDGLKAHRAVVRLQDMLDSVTSQAAQEREMLARTIQYQNQVMEASRRETQVLKAQLDEALETLGTLLLRG